MIVGKIISIFDISIEVVLENNEVKVGDILEVEGDSNYRFEVVEISNTSAICISLDFKYWIRSIMDWYKSNWLFCTITKRI